MHGIFKGGPEQYLILSETSRNRRASEQWLLVLETFRNPGIKLDWEC